MILNATEYEILRKLIHKQDEINDAADDATWILTSAFIIFTMQVNCSVCLYL